MKVNKKYTSELDLLYFNCETEKKDFLFLKGSLRQKGPKKRGRRRNKSEQKLES